jgi:signal transduction histidine kinase
VLTLAGGDGPARSRAVTAALAAGFGAWYWAILVLHRDWWAGRRWPIVYLVVAAGFFWLLVARDSRYFILVYSLYPQVFGMLPDRWSYLGAAVVTVLPFAASGRLDHLEAGDLLSMVANLALALLVGLFIRAIAAQSERRRSIIAELERARAENAGLLAKVREAAVLGERQRMAREIHDTLAQGLTGIVTQLEAAEAALEGRPESVRGHLDAARRLARESLGEARRSVHDLRPGPLEAGRLVDALGDVARRWACDRGVAAVVTTVGGRQAAAVGDRGHPAAGRPGGADQRRQARGPLGGGPHPGLRRRAGVAGRHRRRGRVRPGLPGGRERVRRRLRPDRHAGAGHRPPGQPGRGERPRPGHHRRGHPPRG